MKPSEFGRQKKPGRTIGDLKVPGSLEASLAVDHNKGVVSRAGGWQIGRVRIIFQKTANLNELTSLFREMYRPSQPIAACFSDDSAIAVPCTDGVLYAAGDLVSCDVSIFQPTFKVGRRHFPERFRREADALYRQARTPCVVRSKSGAPYRFAPVGSFLYSGWSGTTKTDTDANFIMYGEIFRKWKMSSIADTARWLRRRAMMSPFPVEFSIKRRFEQLEFLKTNPVIGVDGMWYATLNVGVLLRTIGQKRDDLPGRGSISDRGIMFNNQLMQAFIRFGNHTLSRSLYSKFSLEAAGMTPVKMDIVYDSYLLQHMEGEITTELLDASVEARYNLRCGGLQRIADLYESASIGDVLSSDDIDKIFAVDYSYARPK